MPTIDEVEGFAVGIYFNDHDPAHVHVVKAGAMVVVHLGNPARIREVRGMSVADVKRAVRIVEANGEHYLQKWAEIHG